MSPELNQMLQKLIDLDGSDLHIKVGSPPLVRINKELFNIQEEKLSEDQIRKILDDILNDQQKTTFRDTLELDFAYRASGIGRFRTNVFIQRGSPALAMRRVKTDIKTIEELELPTVLEEIIKVEKGIVFIVGPTGSGKSTTLASMIDFINKNQRKHIVTIEDPIEYLHHDQKSSVCQREIGVDTLTFKNALRAVTREDPDVIMIGELRDAESFQAAISASETGHLVFCTLHSTAAAKAVARILEFFPAEMHDIVRFQLAANLHAIVAQKLLPKKDRTGVVPAAEILIATGLIRKLIRENRVDKLASAIESGAEFGMQNFNQALVYLVKSGTVSEHTALQYAPNPNVLKMNLKGIFLDESRRILDRNLD